MKNLFQRLHRPVWKQTLRLHEKIRHIFLPSCIDFQGRHSGSRALEIFGFHIPVYISAPPGSVPRPPKELKGFVKVKLKAGETQRISIPLGVRSFAFFDVNEKQWRAPAGAYSVLVGDSSEEIKLKGEVRLEQALTEQP